MPHTRFRRRTLALYALISTRGGLPQDLQITVADEYVRPQLAQDGKSATAVTLFLAPAPGSQSSTYRVPDTPVQRDRSPTACVDYRLQLLVQRGVLTAEPIELSFLCRDSLVKLDLTLLRSGDLLMFS